MWGKNSIFLIRPVPTRPVNLRKQPPLERCLVFANAITHLSRPRFITWRSKRPGVTACGIKMIWTFAAIKLSLESRWEFSHLLRQYLCLHVRRLCVSDAPRGVQMDLEARTTEIGKKRKKWRDVSSEFRLYARLFLYVRLCMPVALGRIQASSNPVNAKIDEK